DGGAEASFKCDRSSAHTFTIGHDVSGYQIKFDGGGGPIKIGGNTQFLKVTETFIAVPLSSSAPTVLLPREKAELYITILEPINFELILIRAGGILIIPE
ncbi:MAG: hypothetical protein AAB091_00315, partial [Elusimicrobiota bacterium]